MKENLYRNTAVLIFANSPEEEMRQKPLVAAEKFYSDLTSHTVGVVEESQLPFYLYSEKEQYGESFGERFYNAIWDVFGRGYEYVITLGNDSPQLTSAHLLETLEILYSGQLALGPSLDGGFYLMGIHRSQFTALNFRELPWQTSDLRPAFNAEVRRNCIELELLESLSDIDDLQDLLQLVNRGVNLPDHILDYYLLILDTKLTFRDFVPDFRSTSSVSAYYNKGSPMSAGIQLI